MLSEHGCKIAPSTYYEHVDKVPTRREQRDQVLLGHIRRVRAENYSVYGARKVWLQLNREGIVVARCTVERLMSADGLQGAVRGKVKRTTIADPAAERARDLVGRVFTPAAPDTLWVADMTYVSTWSGWVYVAFVVDAFARRILGWRAGTSMSTQLVLDALEQAVWTRQRTCCDLSSVVAHTDRGSQYTSIRYTERLAQAGIAASVGTTGDSYDNALAETINGLYKTELIKPREPWRIVDQVEIATAEWVDCFNFRRLYQYCGDIPPAELENTYYAQNRAQPTAELSHHKVSGHTGAIRLGEVGVLGEEPERVGAGVPALVGVQRPQSVHKWGPGPQGPELVPVALLQPRLEVHSCADRWHLGPPSLLRCQGPAQRCLHLGEKRVLNRCPKLGQAIGRASRDGGRRGRDLGDGDVAELSVRHAGEFQGPRQQVVVEDLAQSLNRRVRMRQRERHMQLVLRYTYLPIDNVTPSFASFSV